MDVDTVGRFLMAHLGFDPRGGLSAFDWLATPTQAFAEVTGGEVFADPRGELASVRTALAWYPDDLWRYVLACQWHRIGQEEPFVGRAGEVGGELGSTVIAARLVRDTMRLHMLYERRWPPYSKWLGSAFAANTSAEVLQWVGAAVAAPGWPARERNLVSAWSALGDHHNGLGLTDPIDTMPRTFFDRPFQVIAADRFAKALRASISDPAVESLPAVGAVDQFVDSTDALSPPVARALMRGVLGDTA